MQEQFYTPPLLYTGPGSLASRLQAALGGATRVVVVTDPGVLKAGLAERLLAAMGPLEHRIFSDVQPDPAVESVAAAVELIRAFRPQAVIGLGGGSSMDVAKVAVGVADAGGSVMDYAGTGKPFAPRSTRLIQIPTTSGTGSEATDRGIITITATHTKQGFLSPHLVADVALLDPELSLTLPAGVTAATGLDALTHAVEAYTACTATPLSDVLALAAVERIGRSLRRAVHQGRDLGARHDMALASLWAGMAFNNGGLGICHALAMALGSHYGLTHGIANALLLPYVMEFNMAADLPKFGRLAAALGQPVEGLSPRAAAERSVAAVFDLSADCGIPANLAAAGVPGDDLPAVAASAFAIKRLVNSNPRSVNEQDLLTVLRRAHGGA